jgi:pyrimidine deaminase RibD-like protein
MAVVIDPRNRVPSMSIRRTQPTPDEVKWMTRAVELAERCATEPGRSKPSPKVGAVAVAADGKLLAEAYRGQLNPGDHAEFCLISSLGSGTGTLAGATLYTTLEPCTTRNPPKIPCAERILAEQLRVVYVGMLDPDARIRELGCKALRDANIDVRDFTAELREQVHKLNQPFVDRFRVATGRQGTARFDYMQNDGRLRIEGGEGVIFETRWTMAGRGSIHAYSDTPGSLAISNTARKFEDIDDPGVYEFAGHSQHMREGQIVIFKGTAGYALVRIESVLAGPERGDPYTEAVISYELRIEGTS